MAHKWQRVADKRAASRTCRECVNCGAFQAHERGDGDRLAGYSYGWRPLAGRCTSTRDGQPPKRRLAILAAIKAGRHTPAGIAAHMGVSIETTRDGLSRAKRGGLVTNPHRGWWELT